MGLYILLFTCLVFWSEMWVGVSRQWNGDGSGFDVENYSSNYHARSEGTANKAVKHTSVQDRVQRFGF